MHQDFLTSPAVQRPDTQGETMSKQDANDKLQNAVTVVQSVAPTFLPADGEVMTMVIEWPPGDRLPSRT